MRVRVTASNSDGEWLVLTLWYSDADADRAASALDALDDFVDAATITTARYTTID